MLPKDPILLLSVVNTKLGTTTPAWRNCAMPKTRTLRRSFRLWMPSAMSTSRI